MSGHTKGTWKVSPASYGWDVFAHEPSGTVMQVAPWVASVTHPGPARDSRNYPPVAECEANARLIAAAPSLVEVLSDSVEVLDVLIEDREAVIGEQCEVARDLRDRIKAALDLALNPIKSGGSL